MSRIKTPGHFIYNEYGIMKETQEPDNSGFAEVQEMKLFSKATKAGMIIMLIAGTIMALLGVVSKPIPNLVAWIFFVGLVISIASTLFVKKR